MTQIATGVFKQLIAKKQSALGTKAVAAVAQQYRRVTSTIDMQKATYASNEIRPSQQRNDFRHGVRSVSGTISGELSCGTYQAFMESVLRAAAASVSAYDAGIDVTASASAPQFVDASGGFITAGLRIGMVVRATGFTATGNNNRNFLITDLTATNMTGEFLDGTAVTAESSGNDITFTVIGKTINMATSSHTRDYWTIEHNFADISQSEQFVDCVFSDMNVKMPPSGMATVDFPVLGLDMETGTSAYFTSLTAASTGGVLAAVNGKLYVGSVAVGLITGFDFSVKGNYKAAGAVVGQNTEPDILPGVMEVSGNMTVLFTDATMRDYFVNETEVGIIVALSAGNAANADFQVHVFPRVKVGGAAKDDGDKALTMTMPFTALENSDPATGTVATSYWMQDSAAV
jgi:hypothetical protein